MDLLVQFAYVRLGPVDPKPRQDMSPEVGLRDCAVHIRDNNLGGVLPQVNAAMDLLRALQARIDCVTNRIHAFV